MKIMKLFCRGSAAGLMLLAVVAGGPVRAAPGPDAASPSDGTAISVPAGPHAGETQDNGGKNGGDEEEDEALVSTGVEAASAAVAGLPAAGDDVVRVSPIAQENLEHGDGRRYGAASPGCPGGPFLPLAHAKAKDALCRWLKQPGAVPVQRQQDDQDRTSIFIDPEDERVQKYLRLYSRGGAKETFRRALERCGRYRTMILSVLDEFGLPRELLYLPVIESFYNVDDLSHAGALGLWQLMPERARALGLRVDSWIDERKDPEKSTRAAARYLTQLYGMFKDWPLALAAYNRGEFGLLRDLAAVHASSFNDAVERKAVPRETECFVPQFFACALIGARPEDYGFTLREEQPLPYEKVTLTSAVDLKTVCRSAGCSLAQIRELNPALKAWCTPPPCPRYDLRLPAGTRKRFLANIRMVRDLNPYGGCIKYRVVEGDRLAAIARRFCTTVAAIVQVNRMKEAATLRVDQVLVIRPGKDYFDSSSL